MVYDWKKTVSKSWKYLCFYGIPTVVAYFLNAYPEIAGLTVGTLLTAGANWLKHRNKATF